MLSNHPRRPAPQAASLRNLCVRRPTRLPAPTWSGPRLCRGASRGVTFFFPLNVLSLPLLTTNLFRIRTSMTPLPQPLYNPHLQAPLGSAGNKGLITPLESALTRNSPVTPVESALTKRWGVGSFPSLQHSDIPICFPFIPFIFKLFQTLLHFSAPIKNSTLFFSCNSELFVQNTRGVGG